MSETTVFNTRVNIKDIALLHRYYSTKGTYFPSVSTLTKTVVSFLAEMLIDQRGAKPFETIAEAYNYLDSCGLTGPLKRRGNSLTKALQEESLRLDGIDTSYMNRKGKSTISPDQIERAREILNQNLEPECSGPILGINPGEIKPITSEGDQE